MPPTNFSDRLEIAKKQATLILQVVIPPISGTALSLQDPQDTSNWPKGSTILVKELFDIISNAPTLQEKPFKSHSITPEAQDSIERFTMVMEDVCARLNKAYKKYGSNRELSDVIRHPFSSLTKDGCRTALLKCKDDVGKALTSLQANVFATEHPLDVEVDAGAPTPNSASNHPTSSANTKSAPPSPSTQTNLSSSTDEDVLAQQPTPSALNASSSAQNQEQATVRRRERIDVARTTFETIEAISGTIPVVGSYVGAGAKVGLAVVKMIQVTGEHVFFMKLSHLVLVFDEGRR
ncbi:hypothetical protein FS837_002303 [Tulasnella sp. UAMH 9824]|nr:hypothetical protein FS837_002303 [Tulasnella sp. UAMH 9824]